MPVFINATANVVILANYKVMYSSLKEQEGYNRVSDHDAIIYIVRQSIRGKGPRVVTIVRNPYDRLVSFYEDKMRSHPVSPDRKRWGDERGWQGNQKIFFSQIGVSYANSDEEIAERLTSTSFDTFIHMLPSIYHMDEHLTPQYDRLRLYARILKKKIGWRIPGVEIVKLEHYDSVYMKQVLQIDVRRHANKSANRKSYDSYFNPNTYAVVNKLYKKDFEEFGYEQRDS